MDDDFRVDTCSIRLSLVRLFRLEVTPLLSAVILTSQYFSNRINFRHHSAPRIFLLLDGDRRARPKECSIKVNA